MAHTCNPSTWEVGQREKELRHPLLLLNLWRAWAMWNTSNFLETGSNYAALGGLEFTEIRLLLPLESWD